MIKVSKLVYIFEESRIFNFNNLNVVTVPEFLLRVLLPSSSEQKMRAMSFACKMNKRRQSDLHVLSLPPKALKPGIRYRVDPKKKILVVDRKKRILD